MWFGANELMCLVRHTPQPPKGDKTWNMSRDDMSRKLSFVKSFAIKLSMSPRANGTKTPPSNSIATPSNGRSMTLKRQNELE